MLDGKMRERPEYRVNFLERQTKCRKLNATAGSENLLQFA